ncbi:hypothetical protein TWF281_010568 [Arthrobotrys megalospora]
MVQSQRSPTQWEHSTTPVGGMVLDLQRLHANGAHEGGVRRHTSAKQLRKLLLKTAIRLVISMVFIGLIILTFVLYSRYEIMNKIQEFAFNSLSLFLFLLFGMHFLV